MDNDTPGVADRTLNEIRTWPPGLPIFGLLTPLPATPLYKRLLAAGRLTRPKHWQEFIPFAMAHTPLKMTIEEANAEVKHGWTIPTARKPWPTPSFAQGPASGLSHQHLHRSHVFPGNLLRQSGSSAWLKLITKIAAPFSACSAKAFSTWLTRPAPDGRSALAISPKPTLGAPPS